MIYADRNCGVIVAGATGKQGAFHIALMNQYAREVGGMGVVAGVTPGKAGHEVAGVPVYNSIRDASGSTTRRQASSLSPLLPRRIPSWNRQVRVCPWLLPSPSTSRCTIR